MGTRSHSLAPGLIDRRRQRVRGIAFGGLTFKASQITNLWIEERRHAARPQAQARKPRFGKRGRSGVADPTIVSIRNTAPFSVLGLPVLSLPSGFTTAGLPIGLQVVGAPIVESTVLALAHVYEREKEWHKRHPKLDLA
jgi:hypothetical protein